MSSHHVIRDGQEPPVYLADAKAPLHPLLPDLLEWSPVTICADRSVPELIQQGFKADYILCLDSSPAHWKYVFDANYPVKALAVPDERDISEVLRSVIQESGADFLHVVCGTEPDLSIFEPLDQLALFSPRYKWTWHRSGRWRKWMGETHEIIIDGNEAVIEGAFSRTSSGLRATRDGIIEVSGLKDTWIGEKLIF